MNILLLGHGKTGKLVAEVARQRRHTIQVANSIDNAAGAALTKENLAAVDLVIDFTTPGCVLSNIEAVIAAGKNMVVGTTGWYSELDRVRNLVSEQGTGLVYSPNFSIGVNLFLDVCRASAAALQYEYSGQIFERHHSHKKDAPSGTAIAIQRVINEISGKPEDIEITSFREGEVVGMHEVIFESPADRIYICHDAKSRRGFAEGAVRAVEWLAGKNGFYDFKDVWRTL